MDTFNYLLPVHKEHQYLHGGVYEVIILYCNYIGEETPLDCCDFDWGIIEFGEP